MSHMQKRLGICILATKGFQKGPILEDKAAMARGASRGKRAFFG